MRKQLLGMGFKKSWFAWLLLFTTLLPLCLWFWKRLSRHSLLRMMGRVREIQSLRASWDSFSIDLLPPLLPSLEKNKFFVTKPLSGLSARDMNRIDWKVTWTNLLIFRWTKLRAERWIGNTCSTDSYLMSGLDKNFLSPPTVVSGVTQTCPNQGQILQSTIFSFHNYPIS